MWQKVLVKFKSSRIGVKTTFIYENNIQLDWKTAVGLVNIQHMAHCLGLL